MASKNSLDVCFVTAMYEGEHHKRMRSLHNLLHTIDDKLSSEDPRDVSTGKAFSLGLSRSLTKFDSTDITQVRECLAFLAMNTLYGYKCGVRAFKYLSEGSAAWQKEKLLRAQVKWVKNNLEVRKDDGTLLQDQDPLEISGLIQDLPEFPICV